MADNLSQKLPKPNENSKIANTANIVGNDTLRMGEQDKVVSHPTCLAAGTAVNQRKKAPSFQITSVSVGSSPNSRTSNDGGDDSADDLDESHTDDVSIDNSRITDVDNETPSFSEDTFSKDDIYFNQANPSTVTSVPVIPTSSQYGLAVVGTDSENNTNNTNLINAAVVCASSISMGDSSVVVTDSGSVINIVPNTKSDIELRDLPPHHASRNERFKVVKIESTEPFKRGRWMCMDYLDHTILQQQQTQLSGINLKPTDLDPSAGATNFVGPESGVVISTDNLQQRTQDEHVDSTFGKSMMQDNQQNTLILTTGQTRPIFPNISPGQSLQHDLQQNPVSNTQNSLPQQVNNQSQQISSQSLPLGSQTQPLNPQSQQVNQHTQQMSSQAQHMNPQPQHVNQHLQQQYNSQQINPQSQQFNQPQQNNQPQAQNQVSVGLGLIGQPQQINPQTQQVNQQVTQQFNSQSSHMNSPQQFASQPQQFNQQAPQQMHQASGQQNISQMQQNLPGQNFQNSNTQQVSQAQSMSQVPIQCATSMPSAQGLQHQSLPPQQLQQVINAVNMQQMGVQQGLVQQQHLMQQVPHQGLNQFQHTPQYYGQGGIQILPPQSGMATTNSIASVTVSMHPSQPVQSSAAMPMSIQNSGGMSSQTLPQMSQRQQQMTVQNQQQQMQQQIQLQQMATRQPHSLQQIPIQQQQQQVPIQAQYSVQQHFPVQQTYPVQQQFPLQQQIPLVQLFPVPQQQQVPMQSQQVPIQPHQQQILQQNYQPLPNIQQSGQQILSRNVPMGEAQSISGQSINQPALIQGNQAAPGLHQNYLHQVQSSTQSEPYFSAANIRTETQLAGTRLNATGGDSATGVQATSNFTPLSQASVSVSSSTSANPSRSELPDQSSQEISQSHHAEGYLDTASGGVAEDHVVTAEDPESASGTSAVAIDNKIEQAMDLVKSHLMFAVREEVEVLKEKIAELMERIGQLEVENNLLRAHATPEVMAMLPQVPPPQYPPNGATS